MDIVKDSIGDALDGKGGGGRPDFAPSWWRRPIQSRKKPLTQSAII